MEENVIITSIYSIEFSVNSVDSQFSFYSFFFKCISKSKTIIVFQLPNTDAKLIFKKSGNDTPAWYPNILVTFLSDDLDNLKQKLKPNMILDDGTKIIIRDPENHVYAIIDNNIKSKAKLCNYREHFISQMFSLEITISNFQDTPTWYQTKLGMPLVYFSDKNKYWEYSFNSASETLSLTSSENCSHYKKNNGIFLLIETTDVLKMKDWLKNKNISAGKTINIVGCLNEINIIDPNGYNIAFVSKTKFYNRLKKHI